MFPGPGSSDPIRSKTESCSFPYTKNHTKSSRNNYKPVRNTHHWTFSTNARIKCACSDRAAVQAAVTIFSKDRLPSRRTVEEKVTWIFVPQKENSEKLAQSPHRERAGASDCTPHFVVSMVTTSLGAPDMSSQISKSGFEDFEIKWHERTQVPKRPPTQSIVLVDGNPIDESFLL